MANTYKNIVITPNRDTAANVVPVIRFSGGDASTNTDINVRVYTTQSGTLSFEGSAGQLFSITNDLTNSIFSVNDVSGIPSIDVYANGNIFMAPYGGNVIVGRATNSTVGLGVRLDVGGAINASAIYVNGGAVTGGGGAQLNVQSDLVNATRFLMFANGNSGSVPTLNVSSGLTFNPASNVLVIPSINVGGRYIVNSVALGAANSVNCSLGNYFTKTITSATTITFDTVPSTNVYSFILVLTNGGSATITWPVSVRWPSAIPPVLTSSGVDVLTFITDNGGTLFRGVASMLNVT